MTARARRGQNRHFSVRRAEMSTVVPVPMPRILCRTRWCDTGDDHSGEAGTSPIPTSIAPVSAVQNYCAEPPGAKNALPCKRFRPVWQIPGGGRELGWQGSASGGGSDRRHQESPEPRRGPFHRIRSAERSDVAVVPIGSPPGSVMVFSRGLTSGSWLVEVVRRGHTVD